MVSNIWQKITKIWCTVSDFWVCLYIRFSHFSHFLEIENDTIEEPISTLLGVGFVWSPYEEPFIDFWVCLHKILTFLTFFRTRKWHHWRAHIDFTRGRLRLESTQWAFHWFCWFVYIRISHFLIFPHISQTRKWHRWIAHINITWGSLHPEPVQAHLYVFWLCLHKLSHFI